MSKFQYSVHFLPGSCGRFIMTILYGLLVDPAPVEYSNNSAHDFQNNNPGSFFYYTGSKYRSWHQLPEVIRPEIKYIIIVINADDLEEIAYNNFQKNIVDDFRVGEQKILNLHKYVDQQSIDYRDWPWDKFTSGAEDKFKGIYLEAIGFDWLKGSIDNISGEESRRMVALTHKWMLNDPNYWKFINYNRTSTPNQLVINYSDIYTPIGVDSWLVLDQLIEYTQVSHVDPQVRDNYKRYVDQRNKAMESII